MFRKRFLSHAFLISANSEGLDKAIKSEQGPALVDYPISTKPSDFVLFIDLNASSESSEESEHFQKFDGAFFALKYRISTYFPDFFFSLASSECCAKILYCYSLSFRSSKMSKLLSGRFLVISVRSKGSGEAVYTFAQARLIHRYLTIV